MSPALRIVKSNLVPRAFPKRGCVKRLSVNACSGKLLRFLDKNLSKIIRNLHFEDGFYTGMKYGTV